MQKPDIDTYLRFAIRSLPDAADTAQRLSSIMTLVETAQAALREPEGASRADAALTLALCALKLTSDEFDSAAEWVRSIVAP
jgi:hypothetical protein